MDLLGRGGENSLYLCSDTPEGRYDIALVALDGRGGRRDLSLTIEIAKARVYGGFSPGRMQIFRFLTVMATASQILWTHSRTISASPMIAIMMEFPIVLLRGTP